MPPIFSRRRMMQTCAAASVSLAAPMLLPRVAHGKSELLGISKPAFRRFKLGGFEVTTLYDGQVVREGPHPFFGGDQPPEDMVDLMSRNNLPSQQVALPFVPVIVNTGKELVLFDTGNGEGRRGEGTGKLRAAMRAAGYQPEQIDVVAITHFHRDHIGGLLEGGSAAFPNARYVVGAQEYNFWANEAQATGQTEATHRRVQEAIIPFADRTTFVNGGGDVAEGITAIETFGHTPGHLAYHLESENRRLIIIGDIANHFVIGFQKPDWAFSFDVDAAAASSTRRRVLDMIANEKIPFIGYHMPFPGVGYVEPMNDAFRYVPESYQLDL